MKIRVFFSLLLTGGVALLTPGSADAQGRAVVKPGDERGKVSRVAAPTQAKPAARPAPRPTPKPAAKAKSAAPRNPITGSSVTPARPAPKPTVSRPAPKPAPVTHPTPKPAAPATRPTPPTQVTRPAPQPAPVTRPAPKPAAPVTRPTPPTQVTRPAPKPSAPATRPTPPTQVTRPAPKPSAPATRPTPPTQVTRPAPKPTAPTTRPAPRPTPVVRPSTKPAPPTNKFTPGKVVYPSKVTRPVPRPSTRPAHPATRPVRPPSLGDVIGSNNNSNNQINTINNINKVTNVNNVTNVTNVNKVTHNHISNNWGNQWTNNQATVWNQNRVVNNRPVVINPNFQQSLNYAYRPASWGSRPWWASSTYHDWHHGSWNYGWNRSWHYHNVNTYPVTVNYFPGYRPEPRPSSVVAWGIAAWTLGSLAYDIGYNSYRNPYPAPPVQTRTTVINYTQPLSVVAAKEAPAPEPEALSAEEKSTAAIARARDEFARGDYLAAQKSTEESIAWAPGDTTLHEFRALCLFALGKYGEAAGVLNPVLASGPGWDWATMAAFYSTSDAYTAQLRRLEAYVESHPDSADCHFLLGYHYMVAGFIDEAYGMFDRVVTLQPADTVSAQLRSLALSSMDDKGEDPAVAAADSTTAPAADPGVVVEPIDPVDLEGSWKAASADGKPITLTLAPDGKFTWTYEGAGDAKALAGDWSIDEEGRLVLASTDVQMVAEVSLDDKTMRFVLAGSPVDDPGLSFEKQ